CVTKEEVPSELKVELLTWLLDAEHLCADGDEYVAAPVLGEFTRYIEELGKKGDISEELARSLESYFDDFTEVI
ncbi:MAG: hypothetical protein KAW09_11385, partial [Thermoplasmata archaeon]|nr:hypothetical protein [Thermoplasmata archaeon]